MLQLVVCWENSQHYMCASNIVCVVCWLAGWLACRVRERVPPRHNYDKTTNRNESQLLLFCCTLELYIVNGRLRGDSYDRYTYSSSLRSCTVDYFITELNPQSVSVHLAVGSLNSIFDLSANILSRKLKKMNSDEKWFSLRLKQYRNTISKKQGTACKKTAQCDWWIRRIKSLLSRNGDVWINHFSILLAV
jgi:hypothetical protein